MAPPPGPSAAVIARWRVVQLLLWVAVAALLVLLVGPPPLGLELLWNMLVPVAPLVVLLAPGLWRNVCPLGSTSLLPYHLGVTRSAKLSAGAQDTLALAGVALLVLLVPLRHLLLNRDAEWTLVVMLGLAVAALAAGVVAANKSGWCAGLCPIHPVERLYGSESLLKVDNAHCRQCVRCVAPCPDSVPGMTPLRGQARSWRRRAVGIALVGGFPGFIGGWFMVPDSTNELTGLTVAVAYGWPIGAGLVTAAAYMVLERFVARRWHLLLHRSFAAASVATYYWFRAPALLGWTPFSDDGVLVDLTGALPQWTPWAMRLTIIALVAWVLIARRSGARAWASRPLVAA